ncbi:alanine--tRNA ligase [Candidatus Campbellbacteria bacterium]|nr:MAG: alanine--tRNA ligase [Candidatus Campbellbacteria bacterium]
MTNLLNSEEVRKRYFDLFQKDHGNVKVPSSPLLPENDATTLFTGSGMQPMLPYLLGESHPLGKRICDIQKCFRSGDIDDVGDNRHTTFFEMIGNWSFGDYFKEEQIEWMFEFLTSKTRGLGLDPRKLYFSAFGGDKENGLDKDTQAAIKWQELLADIDIEAPIVTFENAKQASQKGMEDGRIFFYDADENWWSRSGSPEKMPIGEPGGPDSEMFYNFGTEHNPKFGKHCHPACDCGRFMEIGNNVFMTYKKVSEHKFEELPAKNIDHGSGLERLTAACQNQPDIFKTDLFEDIIQSLENASAKKYEDPKYQKDFRIVADHLKSSVMIMADKLTPSNKDAGYILRKLLRKLILSAQNLDIQNEYYENIINGIIGKYKDVYPEVAENSEFIKNEFKKEVEKFSRALKSGTKELENIISKKEVVKVNPDRKDCFTGEFQTFEAKNTLTGKEVFDLFTSFGLPLDVIRQEAQKRGFCIDEDAFGLLFKEHIQNSKNTSAGKFKGGLAGDSPKIKAFHTATHLMLAGLRKYLGDGVNQAGSNITEERTRFDFTHSEKVPREILDKVEEYVNDVIEKELDMEITEMEKTKAKEQGVVGSFWEKYPEIVKVWTIKDDQNIYTQELCGGPHVKNTKEMKEFGRFKIKKEESSSAGVRRIKAVFTRD